MKRTENTACTNIKNTTGSTDCHHSSSLTDCFGCHDSTNLTNCEYCRSCHACINCEGLFEKNGWVDNKPPLGYKQVSNFKRNNSAWPKKKGAK